MLENLRGALPLMFALGLLFVAGDELTRRGRIYDAMTGQPLENAIVTLGDAVARTEANGTFQIRGTGLQLSARAYGYQRVRVDLAQQENGIQEIGLKPFAPKALYLSFYGIGDRGLRDSALKLIETTELNALVIDVKGDRGG
ncbi:MAG TPA: putative glycoside hydrolase, partial [Candidatus Binatia bacterium]|nr:putative glycoside hydrolase [Candidatus Binatia bacterium]